MTKTKLAQDVKERPIIFGAWKVNRILGWDFERDGDMQTRRVKGLEKMNADKDAWRYDGMNINGDHLFYDVHAAIVGHDPQDCTHIVKCPYGKRGGHLWCRETWRTLERESDSVDGILYAADDAFIPIENSERAAEAWVIAHDNGKYGKDWRPSMYMPRWASRLTAVLTDVRVERVQEITSRDAIAEGVTLRQGLTAGYLSPAEAQSVEGNSFRRGFANGWNMLNAKRGFPWRDSPWVWVLSFKRITPPQ